MFKKKATFARGGKVEMISTFQRNRHFRKVSVNETFTHVQEQKKAMSLRRSTYIPSIIIIIIIIPFILYKEIGLFRSHIYNVKL